MQPAQAAPINPAQYQQQQQWYQQQQQSQFQQPHVAQQQYAPPPQQQQQHYAPPQQQQQVYYPPPQATVAAPQQAASGDEIRTLWIGDLQYFMDESYLVNCFGQSGEVPFFKKINKLILIFFLIIIVMFNKFMRIGHIILVKCDCIMFV